ncbi:MAG: FIST C-terminal domain-containing protein [Alphaproteobacteria bacterium]|nr:FIST C-terminal domain-containing protein [Alphaproteobacteria bacterium]
MRIAVAHTLDPSPEHGAAELIGAVRVQLEGHTPTGAMLWSSIDSDHRALLDRIGDALGDVPLIGCTTDGEVSSVARFQEDSVALIVFADVEVRVGAGRGLSADPVGAVEQAVTESRAAEGDLCIALPESLNVRAVSVVAELAKRLGDVQPSPAFPLAVFNASGSFCLRAPMPLTGDDGTITFAGEVPLGARVQLTEGGRDDVLQASARSADLAMAGFEGTPAAALVFACAARKQLLGTRTAKEYELLRERVGPETPVIGFYTYGEIAPHGGSPVADFHNETIVTVLIGARDG